METKTYTLTIMIGLLGLYCITFKIILWTDALFSSTECDLESLPEKYFVLMTNTLKIITLIMSQCKML